MCKQTLLEYRQVKLQIVSPNTKKKKKLPKSVTLFIYNQSLTEENSIRYLEFTIAQILTGEVILIILRNRLNEV